MSKNILAGLLSGVIVAGVVPTTVEATTDFDKQYKVAHDATIKAIETKNQGDINVARDAVRSLSQNLNWARGEFSKQLDTVQNPILKEIVDSINFVRLEGELTQLNINNISNLISSELPKKFRDSYSSARDELQNRFQDKVVSAVKLAEEKRTLEIKLEAQELVDELKTAVSKNVAKVANEVLQRRLDSIVLEEDENEDDLNGSNGELTQDQIELLQSIINSNGNVEQLFIALQNAEFDVLVENKQDYKSDFALISDLVQDGEYAGLDFVHNKYVFENIENIINIINTKAILSRDDSIENIIEKLDFAVKNLLDIKDINGNIYYIFNSSYVDYNDLIEYKNSSYVIKSEIAQIIKYRTYTEFNEEGKLKNIELLFKEITTSTDDRKSILGIGNNANKESLNNKVEDLLESIVRRNLTIINDGQELPADIYTKFLKARSEKYEIKSGPNAGKGTFKTFDEVRETINIALEDDSELNIYELMINHKGNNDELVDILNYGGFNANKSHDYTMPKLGETFYFVLDIYNIAKDALYNNNVYGEQNIQNWIDAVDLSYSFKDEISQQNLVEILDNITYSILDIEIPSEFLYNLESFENFSNLTDLEKKDIAYLSKLKMDSFDSSHIYWRAINSVHISLLQANEIFKNIFNTNSTISLNQKEVYDYKKLAKVLTVINNNINVSVEEAKKFIENRVENENGYGTFTSFDEVRELLAVNYFN